MILKKILTVLISATMLMACHEPDKSVPAVTKAEPIKATVNSISDVSYIDQIAVIAQQYFKLHPETATYYGLSDADAGANLSAQLSHYDPASEKSKRATLKSIIKALGSIDISKLSDREKLNLNMIQTEISGASQPGDLVDYGSVIGEYGNWFLTYPVSHLSGPHIEVINILEEKAIVKTDANAEAYIARLNDYPNMVSGLILKIKHDQDLGVIPPDFVLDNVIAMLTDQLAGDARSHPLLSSFQSKIADSQIVEKDAYILRVENAVKDAYYAGTSMLLAAVVELRKSAVHDVGVSLLPNGKAFYAAMILHMTDTNLSAETIHALGLTEVTRIHGLMDTLLKKVGLKEGEVGERMEILLNDPQYLYEDSDAGRQKLIADLRGYLDSINPELPKWFGMLPDQDVMIKAIPKERELSGCGGCYDAPSKEAGTQGTFWINLANIAASPAYGLQTLTYHETNPGHHLQTILGLSDALPLLTTVFYSNAAGEGWGLYSEYLASEMGLYKDNPVNDLGRLQAELHRAVRLVVDTGMHALGWTREQAIDYSVKTEGIHISEATNEVERYAIWPGQALGYKLGQLKILELRETAREQLGEKFDIRLFHDRVLEDGSLPLNLLEDKIIAWINSQK